jgi:hypothetical protein
MWAAVSARVLFLNEQASSSARTSRYQFLFFLSRGERNTSQTINSPLFELLERDIRGRRSNVEVQAMLVFLNLVRRCRKLFVSIVHCLSLRINA